MTGLFLVRIKEQSNEKRYNNYWRAFKNTSVWSFMRFYQYDDSFYYHLLVNLVGSIFCSIRSMHIMPQKVVL